MNYDIVIFDCDGVILNSNKIKTDAFRKALSHEKKDLVDEFIRYHKENGGISRYKKIKFFYTDIKKDFTNKDIDLGLWRYGEIVKKELLNCEMIDGIESYLISLYEQGIPCFVNTGSDEEELVDIFDQRGILKFFKQVLGSPNNKFENMYRIENQISSKSILYFGDARVDMQVANDYQCEFIYVKGVSEWKEGYEVIQSQNGKVIEDFINIEKVLKESHV